MTCFWWKVLKTHAFGQVSKVHLVPQGFHDIKTHAFGQKNCFSWPPHTDDPEILDTPHGSGDCPLDTLLLISKRLKMKDSWYQNVLETHCWYQVCLGRSPGSFAFSGIWEWEFEKWVKSHSSGSGQPCLLICLSAISKEPLRLVFGAWHPLSGSWSDTYRVRAQDMVTCTWHQAPCTWCQVPGTRCRVKGTRYRLPCTWHDASGKFIQFYVAVNHTTAMLIHVVLEFNGVAAVLLNVISRQVSPTPLLNLFLACDTLLVSCSLGSYRSTVDMWNFSSMSFMLAHFTLAASPSRWLPALAHSWLTALFSSRTALFSSGILAIIISLPLFVRVDIGQSVA